MNLFLSNLLAIFILGGLSLVASWFHPLPKCSKGLFWFGLAVITIGIVGLLVVVVSPPGREPTIPEPNWVRPDLPPSTNLVTILSADWDAAAYADWPVAELMGEISEAAYLAPVEAEAKLQSLGFTNVDSIKVASMLGYVLKKDDIAVIVFRGTDDVPDWIANLKTFPTRTSDGRVHRGFYKAYQSLSGQVKQLLRTHDTNCKTWITGHSLGGALAVLCAYDLIENENREVTGLITFGQPMVARKDFAQHLNDILNRKYAHFVNDADVVPRIPPSYRHCGSLVWYTEGMIRRSESQERSFGASADDRKVAATDREEDEEIEPLSEREFRELQRNLKAAETVPEVTPDGAPMVGGSSPLIEDHAMALYLEKILFFLNRDASN
ncbi:lipase family protein [Bythopirellula goksoeyrii]|uniref:Lipase (Class 3) n=1 Tax=Bythopirellula goksoeyrii TaxID=1400387 RepID=A0A5B9QDM4_9BACT|nr:lipase family protein [Bythopirellula goksoeyrii]QEG35899.1 Lipase (class 3) [Bythopirellula goksoeyrii]